MTPKITAFTSGASQSTSSETLYGDWIVGTPRAAAWAMPSPTPDRKPAHTPSDTMRPRVRTGAAEDEVGVEFSEATEDTKRGSVFGAARREAPSDRCGGVR